MVLLVATESEICLFSVLFPILVSNVKKIVLYWTVQFCVLKNGFGKSETGFAQREIGFVFKTQ